MNNYNQRVMTLHPDEHTEILRLKTWEVFNRLREPSPDLEASQELLREVATELECLTRYLRNKRVKGVV